MGSFADFDAYLSRLKLARNWCAIQYAKRSRDNHNHPSFLARDILVEADKKYCLESFGAEGFCIGDSMTDGIEYLNQGDTYATTLLVKTNRHSAKFSVGSWGDCVEPNPEE